MLARDCRPMPAGVLPLPGPLPNLRDALQSRAAVFGPVEAEVSPAAPLGLWRSLGAVARRAVEALTPGFAS